MSAPAPRREGKPDFTGIWQVESAPRKVLASLFPPGVGLLPGGENGLGDDPATYFLNILADYKPGEEPLTPAAGEELRRRLQGGFKGATLCEPPSVPIADLLPAPFKILQMPRELVMLYEADTAFRQIFTDGRKHPSDPQPSWLGYSVGRWEGDVLVVEVTGFNDRSALDAMGHFHSAELRVTERFRRTDFGHMEAQIAVDDPKTLTKPVTVHVAYRLLPDTDLIESFCSEGEKDLVHLAGR